MARERKRSYTCKLCFVEFDSPEELDLHYELSHSDPGDSIEDDYY